MFYLFIEGLIIGFVVAVPVGPIGLLCVNRTLAGGPAYGLYSGIGIAAADAVSAAVAALGLTLISSFLTHQHVWLRLMGGLFLCYLGFRTFFARPALATTLKRENSMVGAFASTFLLTLTNPATILAFLAIYAGLGLENLSDNYAGAAALTAGVFFGSALWWLILSGGLLVFRMEFTHRGLGWVHRISGAIIVGFGFVVLLSR